MSQAEVERESLQDEMRSVVEEARMVIPGIQALFGFQTMAVFNQRFEDLPRIGTAAYLAGLGLLALAIALLLTPAAYHRLVSVCPRSARINAVRHAIGRAVATGAHGARVRWPHHEDLRWT